MSASDLWSLQGDISQRAAHELFISREAACSRLQKCLGWLKTRRFLVTDTRQFVLMCSLKGNWLN